MVKRLYIGNLPYSATEQELVDAFAAYDAKTATIVIDRETGRSRGFGFVDVEKFDEAMKSMNGADMGGRKLIVNEARERSAAPSGGGNRRDNRDRNSY